MMKRISEILSSNTELVEKEIERIFSRTDGDYPVLFEAMKYSAMGGGKRIRPALTLEFSRMLGGNEEGALALAVAVELTHTYSLIHDDLPCMDNDDFRRNRPSNHRVFGEATALLGGDALLTLAFSVICGTDALSDTSKVKAVSLLAESAGAYGMIGGQQLDLIGEKKSLSETEHRKMNLLKTGALMKCAALFGCISAGADENAFRAAGKYAENLGLAFQVTDDLLDCGEEENKTTYLSFMSAEQASEYAARLTSDAVEAISGYKNNEILTDLAGYLLDRTV